MIVLTGFRRDESGAIYFSVNDPIAKGPDTPAKTNPDQERFGRLGEMEWPENWVRRSSTGRWIKPNINTPHLKKHPQSLP
jgi:hypothetical protein